MISIKAFSNHCAVFFCVVLCLLCCVVLCCDVLRCVVLCCNVLWKADTKLNKLFFSWRSCPSFTTPVLIKTQYIFHFSLEVCQNMPVTLGGGNSGRKTSASGTVTTWKDSRKCTKWTSLAASGNECWKESMAESLDGKKLRLMLWLLTCLEPANKWYLVVDLRYSLIWDILYFFNLLIIKWFWN